MAAAATLRRHLWFLVPGAVLFAAFWLAVLSFFVTHGPQGWRIRAHELFRVPSVSMQPTIRAGETVLADMSYYRDHAPSRGDLVIYHLGGSAEVLIVKRILALGGDRVLVKGGRAIVNGVELDEPYADFGDPDWGYNNTQVYMVPPAHVFVLGDNRANSRDSRVRAHGFVAVENLDGRATRILFTWDLARLGRWIGTPAR
jgi:signal peptidase I